MGRVAERVDPDDERRLADRHADRLVDRRAVAVNCPLSFSLPPHVQVRMRQMSWWLAMKVGVFRQSPFTTAMSLWKGCSGVIASRASAGPPDGIEAEGGRC